MGTKISNSKKELTSQKFNDVYEERAWKELTSQNLVNFYKEYVERPDLTILNYVTIISKYFLDNYKNCNIIYLEELTRELNYSQVLADLNLPDFSGWCGDFNDIFHKMIEIAANNTLNILGFKSYNFEKNEFNK